MVRVAVVIAAMTAMDAAEPGVSGQGNHHAPPAGQAELPDFIVPFASDVRVGYSVDMGRYHRSQDGGEGVDEHFIGHGLWVSHVRALSRPGRTLSGQAEWRAEAALLLSQADVRNPNGSVGVLQAAALDLGIGPSWALTANGTSRLELEVMPFVGIGLARYTNDYTSADGQFRGRTSIEASGPCLEYGIKANLMWCWSNGWGAALHAGFVQRAVMLDGDSRTLWNNGFEIHSGYASDDTLTGVRAGLFLAKRF